MHASDYQIDLAARRRALESRQRRAIVAARADGARARRGSASCRRSKATSRTPAKGAGRCTKAIERGVPLPVLTAALFTRFRSREDNPFAERLLAALRNQFGGHAVKKDV